MKLILILLIAGCSLMIAQTRPAKMQFGEIEVDNNNFVMWQSWEIDSTYLNVRLPNGDLPRRANGTYLYWKADSNGNLTPRRIIDYKFPMFDEGAKVNQIMSREKDFFDTRE